MSAGTDYDEGVHWTCCCADQPRCCEVEGACCVGCENERDYRVTDCGSSFYRRHGDTVSTVAALYVDPNGVYAGLPGVEVWDEARDARLYAGPWPVVAHPPCQAWSLFAPVRQKKHGHKIGEDGGCFASALLAVRTYGGVLEHPAHSRAWQAFGLPRPAARHAWALTIAGEWYAYVDQYAYGHTCYKPTWLLAVGVTEPPSLLASEGVGIRFHNAPGRTRERQATPVMFRDLLLEMARASVLQHA